MNKKCFADKGGGRRGDTHKEDEVEEEQEVLDRRHAAFSHDATPAYTNTERHQQVKGSSRDSTLKKEVTNADRPLTSKVYATNAIVWRFDHVFAM